MLKRLEKAINNLPSWNKLDSAWLVVDTDKWTKAEQKEVINFISASEKISLAASNPSFELWLLFHFRDAWSAISQTDCENLLSEDKYLGVKYNKSNYDTKIFIEKISSAINRSGKVYGKGVEDKWPSSGKTQVHLLVQKFLTAQ